MTHDLSEQLVVSIKKTFILAMCGFFSHYHNLILLREYLNWCLNVVIYKMPQITVDYVLLQQLILQSHSL